MGELVKRIHTFEMFLVCRTEVTRFSDPWKGLRDNKKNLTQGGSTALRSDPLPSYIPLLAGKITPFVYLALTNGTPFVYPPLDY